MMAVKRELDSPRNEPPNSLSYVKWLVLKSYTSNSYYTDSTVYICIDLCMSVTMKKDKAVYLKN